MPLALRNPGAMSRRGAALLTTLGVAGLLAALAMVLLALFLVDYQGHRHQQNLVQARANARSGLALLWRQGPPAEGSGWTFGKAGSCQVTLQGDDVLLEGQFGRARVQILCPEGDPARAVERVP